MVGSRLTWGWLQVREQLPARHSYSSHHPRQAGPEFLAQLLLHTVRPSPRSVDSIFLYLAFAQIRIKYFPTPKVHMSQPTADQCR